MLSITVLMFLYTFAVTLIFGLGFIHLHEHLFGDDQTLPQDLGTLVASEASREMLQSYRSFSFSLKELSLALAWAEIFFSTMIHVVRICSTSSSFALAFSYTSLHADSSVECIEVEVIICQDMEGVALLSVWVQSSKDASILARFWNLFFFLSLRSRASMKKFVLFLIMPECFLITINNTFITPTPPYLLFSSHQPLLPKYKFTNTNFDYMWVSLIVCFFANFLLHSHIINSEQKISMKVQGCFYKINVGARAYKVYVIDLRYSKKIRKIKTPALPKFSEDGEERNNTLNDRLDTSKNFPQISS